ncbi:MAG: putative solute:sodium symporter small subunit [Pseudohongiellaceae bacterium]|jgi:putative solute:sodium symporter small subunit
MSDQHAKSYWKSNLTIVLSLLTIWFFISFVCGILFVDYLDNFRFGGFKLGFWIAQQGSIVVFLILVVAYIWLMDRLDNKYTEQQSSADTSKKGDVQ